MNLGVNLYSVRNLIQTEEDLTQTTAALREMGYAYLQYSGAPFDGEMIRRVSEKTGMPFVLTHVPMERILDDTENLMKEHALFGCRNIGLGSMPWSQIRDADEMKEIVGRLDAAAERMEKNGFTFFYHNHHTEFQKFDGQTVLSYIAKNAPHIRVTLDIFWAQYGGADVLSLVRELKGRIGCVHLKDYVITRKDGKFEPLSTAIGDGNFDLPRILSAMKESGTQYYLIEDENAAEMSDTLGEIKRNIDYARAHLPILRV